MKKIKRICMAVVACAMFLSTSSVVMANGIAPGAAGGYTIVTDSYISIVPFSNISNGALTGTWTHGNSGVNFFSTVVGSSQNDASRASGRGSVINGNGTHDTGDWQQPGTPSRGSAFRTPWGTNRAYWDLRRP